MSTRLGWGHININVSHLETAITFYEKLGFEIFLPGIPYLGLRLESPGVLSTDTAQALGVPSGTSGRACIMQLDGGFPKLDLTEFADLEQGTSPLANQDVGLVRVCLVSQDLTADYENLLAQGVEFLTPPVRCDDRLADVAVCQDPDGTLIEILQVYLDRWQSLLS